MKVQNGWYQYQQESMGSLVSSKFSCFRPGINNPLRAIFFKENIKIYLHFMSFLHMNKTQVVEIPPRGRQKPVYTI